MELLLGYIEQHVSELAADLLPSLREGDAALASADPVLLKRVVEETSRHLVRYARTRDPFHLDDLQRDLAALRPAGIHLSAAIRLLFGVEDLVAIRAMPDPEDLEEYVDDLRALRATLREAICTLADRYQQRFVRVSMPSMEPVAQGTLPVRPPPPVEPQRRVTREPSVVPAPAAPELLLNSLTRPVGRAEELRLLWGRLRALSAHPDSIHQVVGIKGADGLGKTTLVRTFLERVEQRLNHVPVALTAPAARLFELPDWAIPALLRPVFGAGLGLAANEERVARTLTELTDANGRPLKRHLPWIMRFLGEEREDDEGASRSPRAVGLAMRDALVAVIEALARQAVDRTGAPLFLVFEDASELDGPTWTRLGELLRRVDPTAPLMVLLTYDAHFTVPGEVGRFGGFTEMTLAPFDMDESEQLINAVLDPNDLDEQTRLRLTVGAQGSPLLLAEALRQLVEDGIIGRKGRRWSELQPLPEGAVTDLATIVVRRRLGL
ncbi:MAG: AAA family ATPase, partial [Myxococcales bacterium]|nr:AAA family ATPase [Myxococcales bacterium]